MLCEGGRLVILQQFVEQQQQQQVEEQTAREGSCFLVVE